MLPAGADAVVMVEHTHEVGDATIEVTRPVAPGENVVEAGEDVQQGDTVLTAGHRLRAHDAGALAALGVTHIEVTRRPRVGILSTGDEVIPADGTPVPGQVRDVNSTALTGRARQAGAEPRVYGIAPDDRDALEVLARRAFEECDLTAISAGSSVSTRDVTAEAISALGKPGVLAHGVSVKPGKPTIVAVANGRPVFGLPGNPVAPTIRHLRGGATEPPAARARARLARNIASAAGRVDFVQVRLVDREGELWAEPEFGKSNLIFTMVRAAGMIEVPLDLAGLQEGTWVDVRLH
jgi:molybdopterin molybdotransferase